MPSDVATVRSHDEIESAIRDLTPANWIRLHKAARYFALSRPVEPEELLQQAFLLALNGSRRCPTHVDVVPFLVGAMRSIAHGELEKTMSRPTVVPASSSEHYQAEYLNYPDPAANVEDVIVGQYNVAAAHRAVLALFEDDPQARDIVEGRMAGLSPEELRELTGLDPTAYASKCRLIRRRIDKAYPEGWTP